MFVTTKTPLAEWLEAQASATERHAEQWPYAVDFQRDTQREVMRLRAAAFALRRLTPDQEADMLEFQVGGPDSSGDESAENPVTIMRPQEDGEELKYRSPRWYAIRRRLVNSLKA